MYLQDLLKFVPGRQYSPALMPKGKGASNKPQKFYKREERKRIGEEQVPGDVKRLAPVSHKKLLHFLKDQRKEISDFVKETCEEKFRGNPQEESDIEENVLEESENDVEMDSADSIEHVSDISSGSSISEIEWNEV